MAHVGRSFQDVGHRSGAERPSSWSLAGLHALSSRLAMVPHRIRTGRCPWCVPFPPSTAMRRGGAVTVLRIPRLARREPVSITRRVPVDPRSWEVLSQGGLQGAGQALWPPRPRGPTPRHHDSWTPAVVEAPRGGCSVAPTGMIWKPPPRDYWRITAKIRGLPAREQNWSSPLL
jgi:hypothetical protein